MAFRQMFNVFLYKNWLYIKFNITAILLVNIGSLIILVLFLGASTSTIVSPLVVPESVSVDTLTERFPANDEDFIYYNPSTPFTDELMENVRTQLQLLGDKVQPIRGASKMHLLLEHDCRGNCFAVDFTKSVFNDSSDYQRVQYSISSTAMRISPNKRYVNDEVVAGIIDSDQYMQSGFFVLQHIIDRNLNRMITHSDADVSIEIVSMPSPQFESQDSTWVIRFGSLFIVLFGVILLSTFVVPLVEEKQDGIKEFLNIATSENYLNGLTFFVLRFVIYILLLTVTLIAAYHFHALGVPSTSYIVILYALYMVSYMAYAYLISVFFNSVFYAKVGGLMMLIAPYIFHLVDGGLSNGATYFLSTKAFIDGLRIVQIFTNKHRNIIFGDLDEHIVDNSHSLIGIYGILILQTLVYSLIYNYLTNVFPGPGGLKKPYLFFMDIFHGPKLKNEYTTGERLSDAIIIQDLQKKFCKSKREVIIADRLNTVIKNKQITVLLGHNGAGKTTTLNMIMGSVPKDGGKIVVCCERDVSSYRHLIGLCPQHSVFMSYMTCAQHLEFFAQLRGLSKEESKILAQSLLNQLQLNDKANEFGKNLSGGMKRRLSLGIALSGETKVVILDEPSSGLDIDSRRQLWDILLKLRKTRAILVTTHHMEEADILGDTVCILANGRLQHSGSPLELKRRVGSGYILKLSIASEGFQQTKVLDLIQRHIPGAMILNVVHPSVRISLPYRDRGVYAEMLRQLESEADELFINSISVADTSLEDVILNCASDADQVDGPNKSLTGSSVGNHTESFVPYQRLNKSFRVSATEQFIAIAYKKCTFICNEWRYLMLMISLPFVAVGLAIFLMYYVPDVRNDMLLLNPGMIRKGVIYLHAPNYPGIHKVLNDKMSQFSVELKTLNLPKDSNVTEKLLAMQQNDYVDFLQNVIGVIEVPTSDLTEVKLHFSSNVLHSSVVLLNLVDTVLLDLSGSRNIKLDTYYYPIRRYLHDISPTRLEYYAVIVPIGLFFYMFSYLVLPFRENISGFKKLQAIPRLTYWMSVFTIDVVEHIVVCVLLGIFQFIIMPDQLYNSREQLLIITSFIFYGASYLAVLYSFGNCLRSISTISTYLLFLVVLSGILPLLTSTSLQSIKDNADYILFLSFLPDFNLNHQLRLINENFIFDRKSSTRTESPLSTSSFFIFAILISIISLSCLINILDNKKKVERLRGLLDRSCYTRKLSNAVCGEEEELAKEQKTIVQNVIRDSQESGYPLLANNLMKRYGRRMAVRNLNFLVHKQECFGLLGVNGAGKTTTFEMLTANLPITGGSCKIDGVDCVDSETDYRYRFGYCPQGDCLNNFMTASQMLTYMARLRGVDTTKLAAEVNYWLTALDLEKYRNVQIRYYSGGTKRKLSAAVAMIGSPSLILLDEPTTGVDPVSRRFLWKCIRDFQTKDRTIVLTSHSMDECEQLCNRLAIMTDGQFKCLGDIQDLKLRYGSGITLQVKFKHENMLSEESRLKNMLRSLFSYCELRECHAGICTYFIKNENISWSMIFDKTEKFYGEFESIIEDYSVNEATLEDICLRLHSSSKDEPTQHTSYEEV